MDTEDEFGISVTVRNDGKLYTENLFLPQRTPLSVMFLTA